MENRRQYSPYRLLPFILIVLMMIKLLFTEGTFSWFTAAFRPVPNLIVFTYLFYPLTQYYLRKFKDRRSLAVSAAYGTALLSIVLFFVLIVPSMVSSVRMLMENMPSTEQMVDAVSSWPFLSNYLATTSIASLIETLQSALISYAQSLIQYSSRILGSLASFATTLGIFLLSLILSFLALRDINDIPEKMALATRAFLPAPLADIILKVGPMLDRSVKKFIIGKLYTCLYLGLMVAGGILVFNLLSPVNIPYVLLIAFIIGITNIIPYLGPIFGTIPCLLIAAFSGFWPVVALLAIIYGAQQIDNIIVTPRIVGDSVGLQPFWVLLAVVVGAGLYGPLGMVLMVPVTSVILQLVNEHTNLYRKRQASESAADVLEDSDQD
ncbi:AI-2E family transporter [Anaerotalea alkaliphila]|uniref:AI-2E family transporter n=1 Tax=Anaerotalea alkaliphila TaxID=2662126 RepID=A0A7X5HWK0_9FIRM|nr:AI-2E family transporter [Anaerotalea alkaliphila]NDL67975.1 AI-2E family transporter [Anaerotalea alkaliphila]